MPTPMRHSLLAQTAPANVQQVGRLKEETAGMKDNENVVIETEKSKSYRTEVLFTTGLALIGGGTALLIAGGGSPYSLLGALSIVLGVCALITAGFSAFVNNLCKNDNNNPNSLVRSAGSQGDDLSRIANHRRP
jgi:hypothetical protein